MNLELPKGVRAFNLKESFQIDYIVKHIENQFVKWGYEKIILPQIEYFEVHRKALGKELENKTFRLIDRTDGQIITLRADFTAQIARYIASLRKKEFPIRIYYYGNLFRYVFPRGENLWERKQTGIELIGVDELEGDAEIIAVASKTLESFGIHNYQIDVNNIKIFTVLKELLKLSVDEYTKFMSFIKNREVYNLEKFLGSKNIPEVLKDFVLKIPKIQANIEEIKQLKNRLKDYKELTDALGNLEQIHKILKLYDINGKISFDLGEPKEFSYYTGIVFEIVVKDSTKPLAQGGRYDNLLKEFDGDIPATGFAFDILNLWKYLSEKDLIPELNKKDFYIIDVTSDKETAYLISIELRKRGYKVARDIVNRDYKRSVEFALKNGFRYAVVIGIDTDRESLYIYSKEGSSETMSVREFLKKFQ